MTVALRRTPRAIAVRRARDSSPPGALSIVGAVWGAVPNDGVAHQISEIFIGGGPSLANIFGDVVVLRKVRVEWTTVDLTVPPPLTLSFQTDAQPSPDAPRFNAVKLFPVAFGTPAAEIRTNSVVPAASTVSVFITNTGAIAQMVGVYLTGWKYPQTLTEGEY